MKKSNLFFGVLTFLLISFSCSSDDKSNDDNHQLVRLKPLSYTVTEFPGDGFTVNFQYKDELISKITTSFGSVMNFNYSGDKLSSYTSVRNGQSSTTNLTYESGRLIESRTEDDSDIITFFYNASGRVNRTDWMDSGHTTTTYYEYDSVGNVIQSENGYSTFKYIYDNNNNAFRNVFPQLDAEIQWEWFGSQINNQIEVHSKLSSDSIFSKKYNYDYDFNEHKFPTERRQIEVDGRIIEIVNYKY